MERKRGFTMVLDLPGGLFGQEDVRETQTTTDTINSGTYTPTYTGVTNVDTVSSNGVAWFMRIGGVVHVAGRMILDTTTITTTTELNISLPVASTFTDDNELAGTTVGDLGGDGAEMVGFFESDSASNDAKCVMLDATGANNEWPWMFTYRII